MFQDCSLHLSPKTHEYFIEFYAQIAGEEELALRATTEIMMALQPTVLILLLIGAGPHVKLLHAPPLCILLSGNICAIMS